MRVSPRAVALLLLLLLVTPSVLAHIQGGRPILQRTQRERLVGLEPTSLGFKAELSLVGDPLRQFVSHEVDPSRGTFYVEHREDASQEGEQFYAGWKFERLVEYRDLNVNGLFESQSDTVVKSWRFDSYQWKRNPIQSVELGGVRANSVAWNATLTAAPTIRLEVVAAGKDLTDEGAIVRPQDVVLYLDFLSIPARSVGGLYALELSVRTHPEAGLALYRVQNTTTALLADVPQRRAMLVWGGEALVDGVEQRLDATLRGEQVDAKTGERTAQFTLHLPTADDSLRFVMVSALEYGVENRREPFPHVALWLAVVGALALWTRGRRRA